MKNFKKTFSLMMILCLLIIGSSSMATVSLAETPELQTGILSEQTSAPIVPLATNNAPVCTIYTVTELAVGDRQISAGNIYYNHATTYNTAVVYEWNTNSNGTELALSSTNVAYTLMGTTTYKDIAFPTLSGEKNCEPQFKYAKNYNKATNSYSTYTTIAWEQDKGDYIQTNYSYDCKYIVDGHFSIAHATSAEVPTEYDKGGFTWNHGGNVGTTIYGTVSYDGDVSDIEVKIPLLGYKTSSVVVGGVKFSLRTGPKKVSIKANSYASIVTFNFAFAV